MHPAVNANDLRQQYRTVVTVDRAHFKLRCFRNLKRRKSYGVAVGHARPRDADAAASRSPTRP